MLREILNASVGSPARQLLKLPATLRALRDPRLEYGRGMYAFASALFSVPRFLPPPKNRVVADRNLKIPLRDGTRICADVFRPRGRGRRPTLVVRHPYGRAMMGGPLRRLAGQGYVVVHADERGRFGSEGEWYIFRSNEDDGRDLCEWIVRQSWSDGHIGGWGPSMLSVNQWFMALDNPLVGVIAPNMGAFDVRDFLDCGGARPLATLVLLANFIARRESMPIVDLLRRLPALYDALPLRGSVHSSLGDLDWVEDFLTHDIREPFFDHLDREGRYASIGAPAFSVTGWRDPFCDAMIRDFRAHRASGSRGGRASRIVIGPWGHYWFPTRKDRDEYARWLGPETLKWYAHHLKGEMNGVEEWPPVRYYVPGAERWRTAEDWPPPGVRRLRLHLHGGGGLAPERPRRPAPPAAYVYDPDDPVPTVGGDFLFLNLGCKDQAPLDRRPDVLIYRTAPLEAPLELAGPIRVALHVSTDAPDTDFTAKLLDAAPDGRAWNIRDGILRMSRREPGGRRDGKASPVKPGKVYRIELDLGQAAYRLVEGHRLGLHVSSSNFPKFDRNLNTGEDPVTSAARRPARQALYHDPDHPSYIELTVAAP